MGVTDAPFDLVEVKLAPPSTRPGTVAKTDVIESWAHRARRW